MPDATYVRGFKSWLDAGRAVRKGEKGIRIFAPRPWQRAATDDTGADLVERGVSFAVVHVFDVSQTDPIPGHPHPWQPPVLQEATGDASLAWAFWEAMLAHAEVLAISVSTCDMDGTPGMYGYYRHSSRDIWIRPARGRADLAATLAHELAHAVTQDAMASHPRGVREVVAESVAHAACPRFGLDLSLRSVDYVAGWMADPAAFKTRHGGHCRARHGRFPQGQPLA